MSVYGLWNKDDVQDSNVKTSLSSEWTFKSPRSKSSSRSSSPPPSSRAGEAIFNKYNELIKSKTNLTTDAKQIEPLDKPFDFFDDEEFAFGINLLKNNVSCVGENMTKLIQMSQEPWPENVKLFQPYEVEQILLPDNASCLAVQAFLKMCNLPFEVEMRWNAEFMSPSGRVPFIKCGAFVVSELEPIVQFAANKNVSLCATLTTEERAEMRAYMSLITNVLVNAELYISWVDQDTFNAVTRVRNSSVYPWPLGWLQTRAKRSSVAKRLKALHWHDKTLDQVLADVEQCCNSLSQRLGDRDYFFSTPTPLDALIYGHVRALLSATGPKAALMIKPITSALLRHLLRISNLTQMKLTPQEEYLVTQGCQICSRRSPERGAPRQKRSKLCVRNVSRENLFNKDIFGFKPFASKQIIIMTSNEGKITCRYDAPKKCVINEENGFVIDVVNEIIDKVDEIIENIDKNDFEVIAYPNDHFERKIDDYLDTIDENTDVTGLDVGEEEIQVIDALIDNMIEGDLDSDGTVTDNCIDSGVTDTECEKEIFVDTREVNEDKIDDVTGKNVLFVGDDRTSSQGRSISKSSLGLSSGSFTTFKMQSNEEISVESLLKCLRRHNALYNIQVAEVD